MTKNVDVEQSTRAVFAMCLNVTRLIVHGSEYFYFNAMRNGDLKIIKYILSNNGCKPEFHRTSYYDNYERKRMIVRMPVDDLDNSDVGFKEAFKKMYDHRTEVTGLDIFYKEHSPKLFNLWSGAKKAKLINNIADRTR